MPNDKIFRAKNRIRHSMTALPRGGHGIHSPFMFKFVTHVLYETTPYYAYSKIEALRHRLEKDKTVIAVNDFGSKPSRKRRICEICRTSSSGRKEGQLLFRIAVRKKAKNILELGTCIGLGTAYLAKSDSNARILSMEGCPDSAETARRNLKSLGITNAEIIVGNIDETLENAISRIAPIDLAYIDANHREEPTVKYFGLCAENAATDGIFVIDDIDYSAGMHAAWERIKKHPSVKATLNLGKTGIVFFNPEIQRGDYSVRW